MGILKDISRAMKRCWVGDADAFLADVSGVVHIGANTGNERDRYASHGLRVIWVEPIPEVFEVLQKNIDGIDNQTAYSYLVTDKDGQGYDFSVANNFGASSSILPLKEHRKLWPRVEYERVIPLVSVTLPTLIRREGLDVSLYDSLVLDTQGSELLVFQGAVDLLDRFRFIKVEAADFEAYEGCCVMHEIETYLVDRGFERHFGDRFASRRGVGSYYNLVYRRMD
jgi:FkbM family methyltransferase